MGPLPLQELEVFHTAEARGPSTIANGGHGSAALSLRRGSRSAGGLASFADRTSLSLPSRWPCLAGEKRRTRSRWRAGVRWAGFDQDPRNSGWGGRPERNSGWKLAAVKNDPVEFDQFRTKRPIRELPPDPIARVEEELP